MRSVASLMSVQRKMEPIDDNKLTTRPAFDFGPAMERRRGDDRRLATFEIRLPASSLYFLSDAGLERGDEGTQGEKGALLQVKGH